MLSDAIYSYGEQLTDREMSILANGCLTAAHAAQFCAFAIWYCECQQHILVGFEALCRPLACKVFQALPDLAVHFEGPAPLAHWAYSDPAEVRFFQSELTGFIPGECEPVCAAPHSECCRRIYFFQRVGECRCICFVRMPGHYPPGLGCIMEYIGGAYGLTVSKGYGILHTDSPLFRVGIV